MKDKVISKILFIFIFLTELMVGYYVCHIKGYIFTDACSRVANAFFVLYIQPPHLAAIGDIWNPLPSLLELPLMLLWPIYKPIASSCLAGVIMSSCFAAGSGVLLYKFMIRFGHSRLAGIALALFYCFNPFFFVYGFNGMSEVPFSFMLIWLVLHFTEWIVDQESEHILKMAFALMLGFLIRYEIIPISISLWFGFACIILFVHRKMLDEERRAPLKYSLQRVEGKSIILLIPMIYAIFLWMLYCWIIEGNALYFLNSSYSNLAYSTRYALNPVLKVMIKNPVEVLKYLLFSLRFFILPFIIVIFFRLIKGKIFKWDFMALFLLVIPTLALQFLLLYRGGSSGEFRYYAYIFPIVIAWLPYEFKRNNSKIFKFICLILILISNIFLGYTWAYTSDLIYAQEKIKDFTFQNTPIEKSQKEVARYINKNLPNARILMDAVQTYALIINIEKPSNLVITCSYQFKQAIKKPLLNKIEYIVIPSPIENDKVYTDAINREYPKLYECGAEWCTLVKEFDKYYKLYRVNKGNKHTRELIAKTDSPYRTLIPSSAPTTFRADKKGSKGTTVILLSRLETVISSYISDITSKFGTKRKTNKTKPITTIPKADTGIAKGQGALSQQAGADVKSIQVKVWYKVWVGPFSERSRAAVTSTHLVNLGCPVYLPENYPYYIQVGAFGDYKNAKLLKQKLTERGFKVVIMED